MLGFVDYAGHADSKSIRLTFVGAHVAASLFRSSGTPLATLVGRQKVLCEVTAAGRIAGVERRAPLLQRHCLRRTSVATERTQLGTLPTEIPWTAEIACSVGAQVVAVGRDRAVTVPAVADVCDDTVLDKNRASRVAESPATTTTSCGVDAKRRIGDLNSSTLAVDRSAARRGAVLAEGAVRNGECPRIVINRAAVASVVPLGRIGVERGAIDGQRSAVADGAASGGIVIRVVAVEGRGRDCHRAAVVDGAAARTVSEEIGAIPTKVGIADSHRPGVEDGAAGERDVRIKIAFVDGKRAGIVDTSAARISDTVFDGQIRQLETDASADREDAGGLGAVNDGSRRVDAVQRQVKRDA